MDMMTIIILTTIMTFQGPCFCLIRKDLRSISKFNTKYTLTKKLSSLVSCRNLENGHNSILNSTGTRTTSGLQANHYLFLILKTTLNTNIVLSKFWTMVNIILITGDLESIESLTCDFTRSLNKKRISNKL